MILKIRKRDGREVPFNIEKIANAIFKAAQAVGGKDYNMAMEMAEKVVLYLEKEQQEASPSVEQIQNAVEKILIENGHARTAKEFILYRAERTRVREMNTRLMKVYEGLTYDDAKDNDIKRENANIDGNTAMGTMLKYGSEGAKQFYEMFILNPEHAKAHTNGDIHIHDLDFLTLTTTCCQIDIEKLFDGGFCTGHGFLREPSDIQSYSALACIAIQSNQNDQHGGQSIPNFDYGMAKGVAKTYAKLYKTNLAKALAVYTDSEDLLDDVKEIADSIKETDGLSPVLSNLNGYQEKELAVLTEKFGGEIAEKAQKFALRNARKEVERATYQAMEALVHNLNTMHSRAGAQIPFSSINYGTDTSAEGRMVIKNVLLATEAGLGNGETPIFPIHIFKVKEGINYNPEDPNYDLFKLSCRVSAKRLFPNFSFLDAPFNRQYYRPGDHNTEVAYMGCRTRVMGNVHDRNREVTCGRGNLSFTSINLPRLGIEARGSLDRFFSLLDKNMDLVFRQLRHRFEIQKRKSVHNYPFLMGEGIWLDSETLGKDEEIERVLRHGTLSVGFIGLAETLVALTGKHHGESPESQRLGLRIVQHMRDRCDERSQNEQLNYTLLATPAEGLSGRFVQMDRELYGSMENITNHAYYTNSFHIPVYYKVTARQKIDLEAPYHALTNAGHITYIELDGDPSLNHSVFEDIVLYMKESGIGYGSINHPLDRDPTCGYIGVIGTVCPRCGREESRSEPFERIRRITGYLVGTLERFNNAKRAEVAERVKHG